MKMVSTSKTPPCPGCNYPDGPYAKKAASTETISWAIPKVMSIKLPNKETLKSADNRDYRDRAMRAPITLNPGKTGKAVYWKNTMTNIKGNDRHMSPKKGYRSLHKISYKTSDTYKDIFLNLTFEEMYGLRAKLQWLLWKHPNLMQ